MKYPHHEILNRSLSCLGFGVPTIIIMTIIMATCELNDFGRIWMPIHFGIGACFAVFGAVGLRTYLREKRTTHASLHDNPRP